MRQSSGNMNDPGHGSSLLISWVSHPHSYSPLHTHLAQQLQHTLSKHLLHAGLDTVETLGEERECAKDLCAEKMHRTRCGVCWTLASVGTVCHRRSALASHSLQRGQTKAFISHVCDQRHTVWPHTKASRA